MRGVWRSLSVVGCVIAFGGVAHAQIPVFDAANLAQAIRIVARTYEIYQEVVKQRELLERMGARLPGMEAYRTSPIAGSVHDTERYTEAARLLLQALNSGDARGDLYRRAVRTVAAVPTIVDRLPPEARAMIRQAFGDVEASDSVLQRAIHATAQVRGFSVAELAPAIAALERHVLHPRTAFHYATANVDKLAGAALIEARQDGAFNLQMSHALELLVMRSRRERATEAIAMQARIDKLSGRAGRVTLDGTAESLRRWRQP